MAGLVDAGERRLSLKMSWQRDLCLQSFINSFYLFEPTKWKTCYQQKKYLLPQLET